MTWVYHWGLDILEFPSQKRSILISCLIVNLQWKELSLTDQKQWIDGKEIKEYLNIHLLGAVIAAQWQSALPNMLKDLNPVPVNSGTKCEIPLIQSILFVIQTANSVLETLLLEQSATYSQSSLIWTMNLTCVYEIIYLGSRKNIWDNCKIYTYIANVLWISMFSFNIILLQSFHF